MSKGRPDKQAARAWWRSRRNRNKIWGPLLGLFGIVAVGGFLWIAISGGGQPAAEGEIPVGESVAGIELTDIVSGRESALDDYVGEGEIVIVGYMGFF